MKLHRMDTSSFDPLHEEYAFHCPGCGHGHSYVVKWGPKSIENRRKRFEIAKKPWTPPPEWTFTGGLDRPTFSPSLLYSHKREDGSDWVCHLYLVDGELRFLSDCKHPLAGKNVPLGEFP